MAFIAPMANVTVAQNIVDNARVEGSAFVNQNVLVTKEAKIYDNARVLSNNIFKIIIVTSNCHIYGDTNIDISHFPDNTKIIFGKGCKIGGSFNMRNLKTLDDFINEYKDQSEVENEEHDGAEEVGFIDYNDDRYSEGRGLTTDYDDPRSPYRILCITVTDIWMMG